PCTCPKIPLDESGSGHRAAQKLERFNKVRIESNEHHLNTITRHRHLHLLFSAQALRSLTSHFHHRQRTHSPSYPSFSFHREHERALRPQSGTKPKHCRPARDAAIDVNPPTHALHTSSPE